MEEVASPLRKGRHGERKIRTALQHQHPGTFLSEPARLTVHLSSFRIHSIIRAFLVEEAKIVKNVLKAQAKAQK